MLSSTSSTTYETGQMGETSERENQLREKPVQGKPVRRKTSKEEKFKKRKPVMRKTRKGESDILENQYRGQPGEENR